MLESLAQYCKALQTKVQELQQRVDHSDAVAEVLRSDLKRVGGPGVESALTYGHGVGQSRGRRDSTASHGSSARRVSALGGHAVTFGQDSFQQQQSKQSQAHIRGVVGGMDSKVVQLRQLFTSVDPLEQRAAAATAIAAGIRGFLARRRYAVFTDSVVNWRWGRSRVFAAVLQHMTAAVSRIDKGMQRMRMKRDTLLIRNVMAKWYLVVKNVLPLRRRIAQQAEEKCLIKQFKLKMQVFLAFREGCIGTGSTKQARRARRALIEQKRSEIVEENYRVTGLRLLASEEQVMRAVHKQVLANAKEHMRARRLRLTFDRIGSLHSDMKLKTRQANRYFFKKCAGRVFYAWNNWLFLVSVGLDRRRWVAPGKYEIKYNQKQVDNFSRLRCERFCFVAWKRYTRVSSAVTMGFVKKTSALIRAYLVSWRAVVKKFKHLLREAVANWQAYPNLMVTGPFEAWKNLASSARQRREAQERVMSAYRRWKTRQKLAIILRTWRHQAVYGSVEGMYSRTNLTKSLAEQKNMGNSMQKLVSQQTLELEKCRDMIKQEVGARGTLEKTLVLKDQEIVRMKITENHTSQEIHRLHALIDAMAKINPRQMKLINKLQEEFGFTARPITGQGPALPEVNPHAIIEEAEREEVEEAASQDAADTEGVEAEGPAKRMTVRPPRPTAFIRYGGSLLSSASVIGHMFSDRPLTASSDATDVPTTVIKVLNISPEDESILRRTKWLLGRFMMEKDDTVPPKPLSEILREASTLESMDSTLHSDSDDSESSAVEAARMAEEHTDRDGLADKGIFGGRRRHSLVIQPSGELNISKSMSLPLSKSNLSAAVEGGDDDHSVGHEPVSLMCPHCSQGFEAEEAQMEALRAHFRGSPGNAQSLTPSQDASRRNSRAEVAHSDELCDIFDEKPPLQKKKKEKTHKRRNHSRAPRHRRRRLDPVTLEPLPLLPQGTRPCLFCCADHNVTVIYYSSALRDGHHTDAAYGSRFPAANVASHACHVCLSYGRFVPLHP